MGVEQPEAMADRLHEDLRQIVCRQPGEQLSSRHGAGTRGAVGEDHCAGRRELAGDTELYHCDIGALPGDPSEHRALPRVTNRIS